MRTLATVVVGAAREFISDRCPQMAAAIAYQVLFSVIPLVALLVATFGAVIRIPEIGQSVVERILAAVPLQSGLVIDGLRAVSEASQPLTWFGAIVLVWPALGLSGSVRDALNLAWGVRSRSLLHQRLLDLVALLGLALLLAASIGVTATLHALQSASAAWPSAAAAPAFGLRAIRWLFPAGVSFAAFLLLYRFVPNVVHGFRDVWPGAMVAAFLFELAKEGFALYVANWNRFELLYGALGAVMLFLLWVYLSAMILLAGAEISNVYEKCVRHRGESDLAMAYSNS